jgi:hypothetical protein
VNIAVVAPIASAIVSSAVAPRLKFWTSVRSA